MPLKAYSKIVVAPGQQAEVDEELYWYLRGQSLADIRSADLISVLVKRAHRYLDRFDLAQWTERQRTETINVTVARVMVPTADELSIEKVIRSGVVNMHHHADMLRGKVKPRGMYQRFLWWLQSRPTSLPVST
jgi:hypothetical protein